MASRTNFTIRDYSNELSSFAVTSPTGNAGNLVAELASALALSSAVENLTIGHLDRYTYQIIPLDTPLTPSNPLAQRELKWLVSYTGDVSGKLFQIEIAAPDPTDNLVGNSDIADIGSADWNDFRIAFETFARSPDNGTENVTLVSARLVGRNI